MEALDSAHVYGDPWMRVRRDTVRRPDGSTGTYSVVDSADIALVIPRDGERLHLVEQHRYPVGRRSWEFPSGSVEDDVDFEAAARRELREETGLTARRLTLLGRLDVSPSTLSQRCSAFLADDLTAGAPERDLDEQDMRSQWFARTEVEQMIRDGELVDAKSVAAFALLLLHERG